MYIPLVTDLFAVLLRFIMTAITSNFALAIIIFTVLTKALVFPLQLKTKKGMLDQQKIEPKRRALEKKYKGNQQKYNEELQKLYKEEGVSLLGGCLPLLITLPILFGLYGVVYRPVTYLMDCREDTQVFAVARQVSDLYRDGRYNNVRGISEEYFAKLESQVYDEEGNPKEGVNVRTIDELQLANALHGNSEAIKPIAPKSFEISFSFLGLDLSGKPSYNPVNWLIILPILSAISAYLQSIISKRMNPAPQSAQQGGMGKSMQIFMPLISLWIGFSLPAGVTLYWIVGNLLGMAQEPILSVIAKKRYGPLPELEPEEPAKKRDKAAKPPVVSYLDEDDKFEIDGDEGSSGKKDR